MSAQVFADMVAAGHAVSWTTCRDRTMREVEKYEGGMLEQPPNTLSSPLRYVHVFNHRSLSDHLLVDIAGHSAQHSLRASRVYARYVPTVPLHDVAFDSYWLFAHRQGSAGRNLH